MRLRARALGVIVCGRVWGSRGHNERCEFGSCDFSLGEHYKEWHGHLEVTRGYETRPEDAHDTSRLDLALCAKPESLNEHGHRDELGCPGSTAPYGGECWQRGRDTREERGFMGFHVGGFECADVSGCV